MAACASERGGACHGFLSKRSATWVLTKPSPGVTCQVVAIVGASGAGKSTILSLLLRFYEPSQGRILMDGMDITTLDPRWLREQIGLVEQEPPLFSGTIGDNIR
jgi:ABC-type bacteriocin/lantibiotic exporter with double-glycine peptidase domain